MVTTYAVQHPNMSHALLIDDEAGRSESQLIAHGAMYVLRHFDEMLDPDEWVVREVPGDTPVDYSIFQ